MKRMILALGTILLCAQAASANAGDEQNRKEAAAKFKEECQAQMTEGGLDKERTTKFCDCYIENVMKVLTDKEVDALMQLAEDAVPEKEIIDKMEKAGVSCVEILGNAAAQ